MFGIFDYMLAIMASMGFSAICAMRHESISTNIFIVGMTVSISIMIWVGMFPAWVIIIPALMIIGILFKDSGGVPSE